MKTYFYALLLVVTSSSLALSQNRFSISATIAPSQRDLLRVYNSSDYPQPSAYQRFEVNGLDRGITVGVTANYAFHPNWSVSTGLWYNRSKGYYNYLQSPVASQPVVDNSSPQTTLNNLQFPVLINYSPTKHRLSPYLSTGIMFNWNYRSLIYQDVARSSAPAIGHSGLIRPNIMVGLGAQYRFTSKLSLIVQPTLLYELDSYKLGLPGLDLRRAHDYQVGVQTQLKYTF